MRRLGDKERNPMRGDTAGTPLEIASLDAVHERIRCYRRLHRNGVRRGSIVCTRRLHGRAWQIADGCRLGVATGWKIECAHVDSDFRCL